MESARSSAENLANSFDPDQARQNVGLFMNSHLVFMKDSVCEKS